MGARGPRGGSRPQHLQPQPLPHGSRPVRQNESCPSWQAARIPGSSITGSGIYFLFLLGQEISQLGLNP